MDLYEELPSLQDAYIRLLKVKPASAASTGVNCILEVLRLTNTEEKPAFWALSYTWGPPFTHSHSQSENARDIKTASNAATGAIEVVTTDDISANGQDERRCPITCNEKQILVTKNLHDFLFYCSRSENSDLRGYIWIDTICINQLDVPERSHQVNMMAEIYGAATGVFVWLGVKDRFTPLAVALVEELASMSPGSRMRLHPRDAQGPHENVLQSLNHWQALARLFQRTWFNRAWVIQEVIFARKLIVLYGESVLFWDKLTIVSQFLATSSWTTYLKSPEVSGSSKLVSSQGHNAPARLAATKKSWSSSSSDGLLLALIRSRSSLCQDPRDKVYSQLRLGNADIFPTYSASVTEVYVTAAKYILEHSDNLHLLTCIEGEEFQTVPGLPSWVPDWSVTKFLGLRVTGYPHFTAGTVRPRKIALSFEDGRHILSVEAAKLDDILEAAESKREIRDNLTSSKIWQLLANLDPIYVTEQSREEVLWRTLMTNRESVPPNPSIQHPASSRLEQPFRDWLLWRIAVALKEIDPGKQAAFLTADAFPNTSSSGGLLPSNDEVRICLGACKRDPSHLAVLAFRASLYDVHYSHAMLLRPFRTRKGYFGLATQALQNGDSVWIVSGCRVPLIFRKVLDSMRYRLVGGAYVHGFMVGQALKRKDLDFQMISIEW